MRLQSTSLCSDLNDVKDFSSWILKVGDGNIGENNDGENEITIPDDLLIKNTCNPIASIVDTTYPSLLDNMNDPFFFQNRTILAPTNDIIDTLNNYIMTLIPGDEKTYLCVDSPCSFGENNNSLDDIHTLEFFNTINSFGLPTRVKTKNWFSSNVVEKY